MLGQAVKAQRIVAENKGWSTTKIVGKDGDNVDIANWNKQPESQIIGTPSVGKFTESIPERQKDFPGSVPDKVGQGVAWNQPEDPRGYEDHHTVHADPEAGK
jgi:hypothetical protein